MKSISSIMGLCLLSASLLLGGCETGGVQTSSSQDYLQRTGADKTPAKDTMGQILREVAKTEPHLKFPARIGIARVEKGELTPIPPHEMAVWQEAKSQISPSFGEFLPLNPLLAKTLSDKYLSGREKRTVIDDIRIGGARQHLDAVYIYEIKTTSATEKNILSLTDILMVGDYLLPSREVQAQTTVQGILLDVMEAYPYAVHTVTSEEVAGISTYHGRRAQKISTEQEAAVLALKKLIPQAKDTLYTLRDRLDTGKREPSK